MTRRKPFPGRPSFAAVAARQMTAEAAAQAITMNRVLAWHGECARVLVERHLLEPEEASEVAMNLFEQHNRLQPYLSWRDPAVVAEEFTRETYPPTTPKAP